MIQGGRMQLFTNHIAWQRGCALVPRVGCTIAEEFLCAGAANRVPFCTMIKNLMIKAQKQLLPAREYQQVNQIEIKEAAETNISFHRLMISLIKTEE